MSDVEEEDRILAMELILSLTSEECESVTICNANVDFIGANNMIYVCGRWSEDVPLRFIGDSMIDCLADAVEHMDTEKSK